MASCGLRARGRRPVCPEASTATYHASLGKAADFEQFLLQARRQRRGAWRNEYEADEVVSFIRSGFSLVPTYD